MAEWFIVRFETFMRDVVSPPSPLSSTSTTDAGALLHRRQVLQLLGIGVLASGCSVLRGRPTAREQTLHLLSPGEPGSPPPEVLEALVGTGRLLSRHLGFDGYVNEGLLESHLRLKCEERPSYLATYTRYASEVKLPEALSVEWLSGLEELHRVKVVGEIAIMLLIGGGFRTFGFANFNGYPGGFWHHPRESGSFHASDEL
jgi:hypothetical protein